MIQLLLKFWPILLPLLLYALWRLWQRHKAARNGLPLPRWRDGPWFWIVTASFGIGMLLLLSLGFSHTADQGSYVSPHHPYPAASAP